MPVVALVVMLTVLALAGLVAAVTTRAARQSAADADRSSTCNALVLSAIALRQVDPQAVELGCDVAAAQAVIARSLERDVELEATRARLAREAAQRAALERQLSALGERPVTMATALPATPMPGPTVVLPAPTVSPPGSPSPSVPTPAAPRPSLSPTPPALVPGLVCGLLGC